MGRLTYKELSKQRFKEQRNVVISEAFDRDNNPLGYSIAEQLITEEDGKEIKVFLKGGLGIVDEKGLLQLKEAVDNACIKLGLITVCDCECCEGENKKKKVTKTCDTQNKMC